MSIKRGDQTYYLFNNICSFVARRSLQPILEINLQELTFKMFRFLLIFIDIVICSGALVAFYADETDTTGLGGCWIQFLEYKRVVEQGRGKLAQKQLNIQ